MRYSWPLVIGYAVAINAVIIAVRVTLAVSAEYAPTAAPADHAAADWKHALVVAWSGLRGAVSLAAALAIPFTLPSGAGFPDRDLIIFVTFTVILVTLVGGGLTLPLVVRRLQIASGTEERDEMQLALTTSAEAALVRIDALVTEGRIDAAHAGKLRGAYAHKLDLHRSSADGGTIEHVARQKDVKHELLDAQREAIISLRERGEIDNAVLRRVIADLDLEESRGAVSE